jgi:hypothetical protein
VVSLANCARAPDRREQRIGDALKQSDDTPNNRFCKPCHEYGRGEADEATGKNISRIVRTDEDAPDADQNRST